MSSVGRTDVEQFAHEWPSAGQSSQNATRRAELPILSTAPMASDLWQACVMLNNTNSISIS